MRKKQIFGLIFVLAFINVASFAFLLTTATGATKTETLLNEPLRIGSKIRDADYGINVDFGANGKGSAKGKGSGSSETPEIADTKDWLSLDDYYGYYFFTQYDLWAVGEGDLAEVWIQSDLSWPESDPQGRSYPVITEEQVSALLEQFEDTIIPTDEAYFGSPEPHDGSLSLLELWEYVPPGYYSGDKNVILVSNVRDDNYYTDFPYYIAGFYSPTFEAYFDRNIISIDSYQWEERVGPDGDRPYLYEGVIAHEYQHLIHDDYFVAVPDESFMNEACSMFAEVLCGYPTDWSGINSFLATPDNSLTKWEDHGGINILADYGAAFLWATFLNDYVHPDFLKDYVHSGLTTALTVEPGIDLLNYHLGFYPEDRDTFEEVFKAWTLANILGTEYVTIDFDDKEVDDLRFYKVKDKWPTDVQGTDFGNTITILDFDTGVSLLGAYGTDYVLLSKLKWQYPGELLYFDGDEHATLPTWVMDGDAWHSTEAGPLANMLHAAAVSVPTDGKLVFDTNYDIEVDTTPVYDGAGWDFGFVELLPPGGDPLNDDDWITLENMYTTSYHHPDAHPDIIERLPGLTGNSGGWITMDFDLSLWAGMDVLIGFRYMTDWGTEYPGWWIKNVEIYEGDDPYATVSGFFTPVPETDFLVTVLRETFVDGNYYYDELAEISWIPGTNNGIIDLGPYLYQDPESKLRWPDVVLLISNTVGVADYSFSVVPIW